MTVEDAVPGAAGFLPHRMDLSELSRAALRCHGCELWRRGTQTVFGAGAPDAAAMLVGEQPGDQEDRQGQPFVGPAGHLLERAVERAGLDRASIYLTNAVKHFKWEPRGKRRLHKAPSRVEIAACHPWLLAEISAVRPKVIVCLGATAARSVLGREVRVLRERGEIVPWAPPAPGAGVAQLDAEGAVEAKAMVTVHPSSILRAQDDAREVEMDAFVHDLARIRPLVTG
ncbi:MAG TPA: UdgX family uracil-DNA binding protein [Candidatus Sulfotelmatobacter sp.]|nr:UdgX family uracil-DNA binding protein [Candidatus Sulfotelmatobacter sp.]